VLERLGALGLPAFVKPARLGSSVGITRVATPEALSGALEVAFEHDAIAVAERNVGGLEVECGVIGNGQPVTSQPGEVRFVSSKSGWFDYETKFTPGAFNMMIPARVGEDVRQKIRELAAKIFNLTRCSGLARVDFFVDGQEIFVNEVNTMPGLSQAGVFSWLWRESGLEYPEMLERVLKLALERYEDKSRPRF
jgi:D-alanine-D-alanine ligase